jgi:hypothetical protein
LITGLCRVYKHVSQCVDARASHCCRGGLDASCGLCELVFDRIADTLVLVSSSTPSRICCIDHETD